MKRKQGVSRRDFLKSGAMAGVAAVTGGGLTAGVAQATAARPSGRAKDLVLVNGRIHTMDERNRVVSSVTILTVVDGKVVYDAGVLGRRRKDDDDDDD